MSESEEMYLVSIARLKEAMFDHPVPLSNLAETLNVLPVSANQMVRKLEENGQVVYTPYKGVELTSQGHAAAMRILRHRRLWEVFLVNQLKILPGEAREMACKFEHVIPSGAAEKLAEFLGFPSVTPSGEAIPAPEAGSQANGDIPITQMAVYEYGVISRIAGGPLERDFLRVEGVTVGSVIQVLASGSRGNLLLQTADGRRVHLSNTISETIWVFPKE